MKKITIRRERERESEKNDDAFRCFVVLSPKIESERIDVLKWEIVSHQVHRRSWWYPNKTRFKWVQMHTTIGKKNHQLNNVWAWRFISFSFSFSHVNIEITFVLVTRAFRIRIIDGFKLHAKDFLFFLFSFFFSFHKTHSLSIKYRLFIFLVESCGFVKCVYVSCSNQCFGKCMQLFKINSVYAVHYFLNINFDQFLSIAFHFNGLIILKQFIDEMRYQQSIYVRHENQWLMALEWFGLHGWIFTSERSSSHCTEKEWWRKRKRHAQTNVIAFSTRLMIIHSHNQYFALNPSLIISSLFLHSLSISSNARCDTSISTI